MGTLAVTNFVLFVGIPTMVRTDPVAAVSAHVTTGWHARDIMPTQSHDPAIVP